MKKTFKFFAAALAIVAAASCAKEISNDNIQNENPAEETVHMTISASFDSEGETKTVLAENNFVHWTDNDAIQLFGKNKYDEWELNNGVLSIDPASNDDDPTFAVFSGEAKPSTSYYAVSPASGWSAPSMSYFQFDGLYSQNAVKDSFDPNAHVAMSVSTSGDVFKFQNACALLKVKVTADGVYSIKIDGTVDYQDDSSPIGIGMPFRFRPGSIEPHQFNYMYGHSSSIVLSGGSNPLEVGATYYIVVPQSTAKNFSVSLCDANGNTLASKSKKSDFKIERNKIYDLGTFDESMIEKLSVNKTSLSLSASTGFDFFTITSNRNWRVTSDANWISFDITSGEPCSNLYVQVSATDNTAYTPRTATVTITGEKETRTISVTQAAAPKPQTYRKVKQVYPNELVSGKKYVIANYGDPSLYLTNSGNKAVLSTLTNGEIRKENVMVFEKLADKAGLTEYKPGGVFGIGKVSGYASQILGTWKSLVNNYGLGDTFYFGSGTTLNVGFGGRWDNASSYDIDMYKNPANTFIYRNGTTMSIGSVGDAEKPHGQGGRKWLIWEVTEE